MTNLPYANSAASLEKMLKKIKVASVPAKFAQEFVSSKLGMKGGAGRASIPFVKRMGFVAADGTPTKRYREFRNEQKSGSAIAAAMRDLYAPLYEMNERAHELSPAALKILVVEATGAEANSSVVQKTVATFNLLKGMASFDSSDEDEDEEAFDLEENIDPKIVSNPIEKSRGSEVPRAAVQSGEGINLSYTINLNLPASSDIEVFNAIFKSLKNHLLQD